MNFNGFEEEDIQEYVDNLLTPKEARRIETVISANPEARDYYLKQLRQKELLKAWWKNSQN